MKKGKLNREKAIEIAGVSAASAVAKANCDFTNRVGYNGSVQGDAQVEFSAAVSCTDKDGQDCTLIAYYYQDADDVDAAGDDLSNLDWEIEGYEVV